MPHEETIRILKQMDSLRSQWGVVYPFEKETHDMNSEIKDEKEKIEILTGEVEDTIREDTDIQA